MSKCISGNCRKNVTVIYLDLNHGEFCKRCDTDFFGHVTIATDTIIWTWTLFIMVSGWFFMVFQGNLFKIFHFFKFTIVNDAIFCWNIRVHVFAMFFSFTDHRKWLFAMVANHQSIDAMFAMYRSSLDISIITSIKKFTLKKMRDHLT